MLACALLSGCRVPEVLSPEVSTPVSVRSVSARFPQDGRGAFGLELEVAGVPRAGELTGLTWEVWLRGRWFAAGVRPLAQPLNADGVTRVALELPVAFDERVAPGPAILDVGVRGYLEARLGNEERRWPFKRRLEVASDGAPRLDAGGRE